MRRGEARFRSLGAVPLLAAFGFLSCANSGPVAKDDIVKRLTPDDNGKEVVLRPDDRFEVALPETPTSGYVWIVHRIDADYLQLDREDYAPWPEPVKPVLGARETKLFVFRALKKGETKLEIRLRRPWEDPAGFAESYSLKLRILSR